MHFWHCLPFLLAPAALASRYHHGHGYGRVHNHHRALGTVNSQSPISSAVSGAPYPIGNSTVPSGSTGPVTSSSTTTILTTSTTTIVNTVYATSEAAGTGGLGGTNPSLKAANFANTCGGTVTVTEESSETVTVTVGAGTSPAAETLSSSELSTSTPSKGTTITLGQSSSAEATSPSEVETSVPSTPIVPKSTEEATSKAPTPSPSPELSTLSEPSASSTQEATTEAPVASPEPSTSSTLVASKTPSTAAAPSGSDKSSSSGGCTSKRGIIATAGGPNHDQGNISLAFADQPKICWTANWYSAPPPAWNPDKQFVPQDYGPSSSEEEWHNNAEQAIAKGEKTFLSFGEPNSDGRDHLEPDQAVDLYMKVMQPYAEQGVKICSPAVLQPRPDMDWLASFLEKCEAKGCTISMICVHWFDTTSAATPGFPEFKRTVENATALANGKPVWVDNFQANGSPEDVKAFLDDALPYLEGNDAVERYAYVPPLRTDPSKTGSGFRTDQMISPDLSTNGTLTELGKYYANF